MTGYAAKWPQWWAKERSLAETRLPDPYAYCDVRAQDFLKGRKPKKLKEGKSKFNEPQTKDVEKRILEVAAVEKGGLFEPRRDRDILTEALGNPEQHSRVHGVSSRKSWKTMEFWQSDISTYHTRQRYKEGLI